RGCAGGRGGGGRLGPGGGGGGGGGEGVRGERVERGGSFGAGQLDPVLRQQGGVKLSDAIAGPGVRAGRAGQRGGPGPDPDPLAGGPRGPGAEVPRTRPAGPGRDPR